MLPLWITTYNIQRFYNHIQPCSIHPHNPPKKETLGKGSPQAWEMEILMENHGRLQVSQGLHTLASREGSSMSLSTSFSISMVYLGAGKIISSSGVI